MFVRSATPWSRKVPPKIAAAVAPSHVTQRARPKSNIAAASSTNALPSTKWMAEAAALSPMSIPAASAAG